jgi:hypothetical protein
MTYINNTDTRNKIKKRVFWIYTIEEINNYELRRTKTAKRTITTDFNTMFFRILR